MDEHFIQYRGLLDHTSFRREITEQHGQSALFVVGGGEGPYYGVVLYGRGLDILAHGFPGNGHRPGVDKVIFRQFVQYGADAACIVQVFDMVFSPWAQ